MDPGTALAIAQLSASVLKLGSKISFEFLGRGEKAPHKLRNLNQRLETFTSFVNQIAHESKAEGFQGFDAIRQTLQDCKDFLKQYETTLSTRTRFGAAPQRIWLSTGPDSTRIDEIHKKFDHHYAELQSWRMHALAQDFKAVRTLMESISTSGDNSKNGSPIIPNPNSMSPQLEPPRRRLTGETLVDSNIEPYTIHKLSSPHVTRSPRLMPSSRALSLTSIPELPPGMLDETRPDFGSYRRSSNMLSPANQGPVMEFIRGHSHPNSNSLSPPVIDSTDTTGVLTSQSRSPTNTDSTSQGNKVTLTIGQRCPYTLSSDWYRVYKQGSVRIVEWNALGTIIRHFIPLDMTRIPYTKPNDKKLEVSFLPREVKHQFEIIDANGTESIMDRPKYNFTSKPDREAFQADIRARQLVKMVQALKIHSSAENHIATGIHLKVWRRDDYDDEPTITFAQHEKGAKQHHVEYVIRWFKSKPVLKGDKTMTLEVYSADADLDHGPPAEEAGRRTSFMGSIRRRSSDKSTSSSSAPNTPSVLYENVRGKPPPDHVRSLKYLKIEFDNPRLRQDFISACYYAHHPETAAPSTSPQVSSRPHSSNWSAAPPPPSQNVTAEPLSSSFPGSHSPSVPRWSPNDHYRALSQYKLLPHPAMPGMETREPLVELGTAGNATELEPAEHAPAPEAIEPGLDLEAIVAFHVGGPNEETRYRYRPP